MATHILLKSGKLRKLVMEHLNKSTETGEIDSGIIIKSMDYEERTGKKYWNGQAYLVLIRNTEIPENLLKWVEVNYYKDNQYSFEVIIDRSTKVYLVA